MQCFSRSLIVLAALAWAGVGLAQGRPAGVMTQPVTVESMTETITVFGEILAERESSVAARVAGVVTQMPIRVGTEVQAGDILAAMDTELLQIEMARAETELAIAEASLTVARSKEESSQKSFNRAESLRATSAIADAQFEDRASALVQARGAVQEAQARVASAANAIDRARYNLDNATVRAPFDGIVLEVATQPGQFVNIGTQVARLLDTGAMEVQANVPARLLGGLQPGLPVDAQTDAGAALGLSLRAVLPTEFSATRTRPVLFDIASADVAVAVGQAVTLQIPVGAVREVVVVPKDALVQARGGWSAFVNEDGKASPRTVEIGASLGAGFEVISGLRPGDEVVVRGNERLRPGQEIAPMDQPPADGAPSAAAPEEKSETAVAASTSEQG